MKKQTLLTGLGAAAVLGLMTTAAPAATTSDYSPPSGSAYPQNIVADDNHATVFGEVQCWGGDGGTLWASIKQGGKGDLTAEGSSATARSWYDTHIPLNCDGKTHVVKAVVRKEAPNPGHKRAYKQLRNGRAWIQWCVTDPTFTGAPGDVGFSSYTAWLKVYQVS